MPATIWRFYINIQNVLCYTFLTCPVSAFLMTGVLPASTQLPAFSLKAKAKDGSSVMVRRCVIGRKEKIAIQRNASQFDTYSLLQPERYH